MSEQKWLIQSNPELAIRGSDLSYPHLATISELVVGSGEICVDETTADLPNNLLLFGVAAAAGMSNAEIAEMTYLSENTIKVDHMTALFDAVGIRARGALPRYFFETGMFALKEGSSPMKVRPSEQRVLEQLSYGKSDKAIADDLHIGLNTVKKHIRTMSERTGWRGRERLALAGFVSGGFGNFIVRGANVAVLADTL